MLLSWSTRKRTVFHQQQLKRKAVWLSGGRKKPSSWHPQSWGILQPQAERGPGHLAATLSHPFPSDISNFQLPLPPVSNTDHITRNNLLLNVVWIVEPSGCEEWVFTGGTNYWLISYLYLSTICFVAGSSGIVCSHLLCKVSIRFLGLKTRPRISRVCSHEAPHGCQPRVLAIIIT